MNSNRQISGKKYIRKLYTYEIRVEGHLTDRWSDWFEGLAIRHNMEGETILQGSFVDQAALFGALSKVNALNLALISVTKLSVDTHKPES
jgi:hypothetical protein